MSGSRTEKLAENICVGDVIVFLGREHRVAAIDPYVGPFSHIATGTARTADGWEITLFRGQRLKVARVTEAPKR